MSWMIRKIEEKGKRVVYLGEKGKNLEINIKEKLQTPKRDGG